MLTEVFKERVSSQSKGELTLQEVETTEGDLVNWLLYKEQPIVRFYLNTAGTDIKQWEHFIPLSISSGSLSLSLKDYVGGCLKDSLPNFEELKDAPYL